jgi:hypothetical protein
MIIRYDEKTKAILFEPAHPKELEDVMKDIVNKYANLKETELKGKAVYSFDNRMIRGLPVFYSDNFSVTNLPNNLQEKLVAAQEFCLDFGFSFIDFVGDYSFNISNNGEEQVFEIHDLVDTTEKFIDAYVATYNIDDLSNLFNTKKYQNALPKRLPNQEIQELIYKIGNNQESDTYKKSDFKTKISSLNDKRNTSENDISFIERNCENASYETTGGALVDLFGVRRLLELIGFDSINQDTKFDFFRILPLYGDRVYEYKGFYIWRVE